MDFIHYKLEKANQGYVIYLYLDPSLEEFSSELGKIEKGKQSNFRTIANSFIKQRFPNVRIVTAKIIIGTTLVTTIPLQADARGADDSFNMSYLYFGSTASQIRAVDKTNGTLDVISPSYFNLKADGSLELTTMLDPTFINAMHLRGIKVVPFLSNHWDRELGREALENREHLTDQIVEAIIDYNLDGVNVDIENVTEVDRAAYTDLVRLLNEKLPADKEISVAIAANPYHWNKGWHGSYDNKELAKYADYLMLMAYDESYHGGEPGPVASLPWVEKSLQALINDDGVPSEKIVLGLPFFGRYWNDAQEVGGYGISNHQVDSLLTKYDGKVTYDYNAQSPKVTFTIGKNDLPTVISGNTLKPGTYEVWYEDSRSLHAKIDLVHQYNLKGTGSWSLGQENASLWGEYAVWAAKHTHDAVPVDSQAYSDVMPFSDAKNHWAHDEILYSYYKNWFTGKTETTFAPNEALTRAQAATVLVRAFDLKAIQPIGNSFSDVSNTHWAKQAIEIATQNGLFKGKGNGKFGPNDTLTREQMAAVIDNISQKTYDIDVTAESFQDVSKDRWSYHSILAMKQQGFFHGVGNNKFNPTGEVTRSQMAVVLTNAADRIAALKGEELFPSLLKEGVQGPEVTLLQIYLKKLEMLDVKTTGNFDSKTQQAVVDFQKKYGLAADGIVGPNTSKKLLGQIRLTR